MKERICKEARAWQALIWGEQCFMMMTIGGVGRHPQHLHG